MNRRLKILKKSSRHYEKFNKKTKIAKNQEQQVQQQQVEDEMEDEFEDVNEEDEMPNTDFEDDYDDEYEREVGSIDIDSEEAEQLNNEVDEEVKQPMINFQLKKKEQKEGPKTSLKRKQPKQQMEQQETKRVWFNDSVKEELLDFDNKAYNMLHRISTEWPCLSCDYILDGAELLQYKEKQYQQMNKYPYTVYLTAGTQAAQCSKNQIYLMKLQKLHKTKYDDESDHEDSQDDNVSNDEEPEVQLESVVGLKNSINRVKSMNYQPIVAYWSENGEVMIVNLDPLMKSIQENDHHTKTHNINQLQHKSFSNQTEGFALDWNRLSLGQLASGGLDAKIQIYNPRESDWIRDSKPYLFHEGSVEDIQFSPVENFAFASCSVDGTLRVTDMRVGNRSQSQILIKAHQEDVNVLSWNQVSTNLIATGSDDCSFKVWDLRYPKEASISEIKFHTQPITSIQFQPNSDSTLAVSSADNKLSIWDFAVENDEEIEGEVPDQLMFVHQGQVNLKELRYHPLYFEMIVSTSGNGFNVFKPTLDEESSKDSEEEHDKDPIPQIREEELDRYFGSLKIQ